MSEPVFKVGDRVRGKESSGWERVRGKTGTVKIVDICGGTAHYGVQFDKDMGGHNCDGSIPHGYGWWLLAKEMTLLDSPETPTEWRVVNRPVKVGDYIRLTECDYSFDEKGDILKISGVRGNGEIVYVYAKDHPKETGFGDKFEWNYPKSSYEVVEKVRAEPKKAIPKSTKGPTPFPRPKLTNTDKLMLIVASTTYTWAMKDSDGKLWFSNEKPKDGYPIEIRSIKL